MRAVNAVLTALDSLRRLPNVLTLATSNITSAIGTIPAASAATARALIPRVPPAGGHAQRARAAPAGLPWLLPLCWTLALGKGAA